MTIKPQIMINDDDGEPIDINTIMDCIISSIGTKNRCDHTNVNVGFLMDILKLLEEVERIRLSGE